MFFLLIDITHAINAIRFYLLEIYELYQPAIGTNWCNYLFDLFILFYYKKIKHEWMYSEFFHCLWVMLAKNFDMVHFLLKFQIPNSKFIFQRKTHLGDIRIIHSFVIIPSCSLASFIVLSHKNLVQGIMYHLRSPVKC